MSLNGVESVNGYLEAIAVDGTAVSKAIVQDGWNNISQSTVPDLLSTSTLITDGDNLDIILNDGSINTVVASGVTGVGPYEMDTSATTLGEIPDKVYLTDAVKELPFIGAKNVTADFEFKNIATPGSIVDTLITSDHIIDGDKLAIIKNDNSVHEMIAANVDNSAIIGTIGANVSVKDKLAFKNTALSATLWVGSNAYSDLTINSSGRYYFEVEIAGTTQVTMVGLSKNNTEQTNYFSAVATGYAIYSGNGSKYTNAVSEAVTSIFVSGDIVGIEYDYDTGEMSFWLNGISFGILYTLGAGITVYPAIAVHSTGITWQNFRFKKEDMSFFPGGVYKVVQKDTYTMDTSSVTAGEIPNKTFRINESIEMNNNPISEDSNLYTAGATLLATRSFGEAVGSGVEIETKVKMSAIGNKMTGMTFDLWKEKSAAILQSQVPIMTSDTTPSGVAWASSVATNDYKAWKAFDAAIVGIQDCWASASNVTPVYLKYTFTSPKKIVQYSLTSRGGVSTFQSTQEFPRSWYLQGSNDGTTWVDVDTQINQTVSAINQTRTYNIANTVEYLHYQLFITSDNGGQYTSIATFDMQSYDTP